MSKTFTPGPWKVTGSQRNGFSIAAHGGIVAEMNTIFERGEADARLIASAPELLAALREAQHALNDWAHYGEAMRAIGRGHEAHSKSGMGPVYLAGYIAATIAKATGEPDNQDAKRETEAGAGMMGIAIAIGKAGAL